MPMLVLLDADCCLNPDAVSDFFGFSDAFCKAEAKMLYDYSAMEPHSSCRVHNANGVIGAGAKDVRPMHDSSVGSLEHRASSHHSGFVFCCYVCSILSGGTCRPLHSALIRSG